MAPAAENASSGEFRGLSAARRAEKERETVVRPQDMEGLESGHQTDCTGPGTHMQAPRLTHSLLLNIIAPWAEDPQTLPVRGLADFPHQPCVHRVG